MQRPREFIFTGPRATEAELETYQEGGRNDSPHKLFKFAKYPNLVLKRGVTFNTVASYTKTPTPEGVVMPSSAPSGLLSRAVLPAVDPGSATTQLLVRWVLDNLTMPRSRFTWSCGTAYRRSWARRSAAARASSMSP